MRPPWLPLALALLPACRAPDPAPERFEELLGWMFAHAETEEQEPLVEGIALADGWLDEHFDETLEGYVVEPLTEDQLASVDADGRDRSGLRGVAIGYPYTASAEQVATVLMERRESAMADTGDSEEVILLDGGTDCFAEGACDWVAFDVDQITDLGFGITLQTWMRYQYRRVGTAAGDVIYLRSWTTQTPTITTDLFSVLQVYQVWMMLPDQDGWRALQGQWVEAQVGDSGLDIDFVMQVWVNGLIDAEARLDEAAQAI